MKIFSYLSLACSLLITVFSIHGYTQEIIAPGLSYYHEQMTEPFALSWHLLRVNPAYIEIALEASHGMCHDAETTSAMARRKDAIAAINGSFFDFFCNSKLFDSLIKFLDLFGYHNYHAFPIWTMKIKEDWFSMTTQAMALLAWHQGGSTALIISAQCSASLRLDTVNVPISEINKPYDKGPILYTRVYGKRTPGRSTLYELVYEEGKEWYIKKGGNTTIPTNGFVYATTDIALIEEIQKSAHAIPECVISFAQSDQTVPVAEWDYLRASMPLLLYNNAINPELFDKKSEFYTSRHPRTAVGLCENGDWLLMVVEGRLAHSEGLSMLELAHLMQSVGSVSALNMGGGGDSVMVIKGSLMNLPSGRRGTLVKKERPIADSLLLYERSDNRTETEQAYA